MKYLGVDYGKKKIGLAKSDSQGKIAFPLGVYPNNKDFRKKFFEIIDNEGVKKIIFGKSLNYSMQENQIHYELLKFIKEIEEELKKRGVDYDFENEVMTSMEARRGQLKILRRTRKDDRIKIKKRDIDDSAASLILKTYLEKENRQKGQDLLDNFF